MKYLVVIEKSRTGYAAYSPDLEGCVAAARTRKATERAMKGALELHLGAMADDGEDWPKPRSHSLYVEVPRRRPVRRSR
jgi:predicted RNase H-like HicB family nuclease